MFQFYYSECVRLMGLWEDETNKMFESEHKDVADTLYAALDRNDMSKLKRIHNQLARMVEDERSR